MNASTSGYSPNHFTIKAGVPVQWNITAGNAIGCASAIVARNLYSGIVYLTPNTVTTKEFTASVPGTYTFSCSMGMYTGSFEVVN
jgi:plastocyanin domain-containing protein